MRRKSSVLWSIFVCMTVLLLTGCGKKYTGNPDNSSTTCGNITMGRGKFAYSDGFIYFTDYFHSFFEYDMETKKTVVIDMKSDYAEGLYIQDNYIYFQCNGLRRIRKDGKRVAQVFEGGGIYLYVENEDAYFFPNGIEGSLYHRNLKTDVETELLDQVLSYYVDEEQIYAVSKKDERYALYVSEKDNFAFTVRELSFLPIAVLASEGELYLSERASYQIVKVSEEGEERLPIRGTYYQVLGSRVLFLDSDTYKNSLFDLVMYDMVTGESTTMHNGVFDFNVFDERYVCIVQGAIASSYYVYDLETGETLLMYGEEE